jgi:hypothetical protein
MKIKFPPKLSRRSIFISLAILGILYWYRPKPAAACQSLQRFGATMVGDRCIIKRDVYLSGSVETLPNNLTIEGNFTIAGTSIENLPDKMIVTGGLYFYKTSISKLPPDLQVFGGFDQDLGFGSPGVYCKNIPSTVIIKLTRRCF